MQFQKKGNNRNAFTEEHRSGGLWSLPGRPADRRFCRGIVLTGDDRSDAGAHADPDLIAGARKRGAGWLPSLGQIGAASGHLRNQGVQVGDLFLFYGWSLPEFHGSFRLSPG